MGLEMKADTHTPSTINAITSYDLECTIRTFVYMPSPRFTIYTRAPRLVLEVRALRVLEVPEVRIPQVCPMSAIFRRVLQSSEVRIPDWC